MGGHIFLIQMECGGHIQEEYKQKQKKNSLWWIVHFMDVKSY